MRTIARLICVAITCITLHHVCRPFSYCLYALYKLRKQRIGKGKFESIPDNRKIMMLRHLRSLVVAYDHLSDERRRELTTALEIIKNREVLNRVSEEGLRFLRRHRGVFL